MKRGDYQITGWIDNEVEAVCTFKYKGRVVSISTMLPSRIDVGVFEENDANGMYFPTVEAAIAYCDRNA